LAGRKSDIIVTTEAGIELSIFEFKHGNSQVKRVAEDLKQESKSIRLNCSVKKIYSSLGADNIAMGMDWIGIIVIILYIKLNLIFFL
jgi:hypothetical protein